MTVPLLDPRKVLSPNVRVQQMTRDLVWLFNDSRFHVCWRSVFRLVDHMVADVEMCHNHLKKMNFLLTRYPSATALLAASFIGCVCVGWGRSAGVRCLHFIFPCFHKNFPFSVSQRDTVGFAWLIRLTRTGPWLAAEKLSSFDSSQVCSEMPFFKRQKAGEAFASDSRVP